MMRTFYTIVLWLAVPLVLVRLWWRGREEPGYRKHLAERFGYFTQLPLEGSIWIHAVSVGEIRAAAPLVAELKSQFPSRPILLTCMTVTGRATAASLFGELVTVAYLPYDFPHALRHLLTRFRPAVLLVMETEIWFNLMQVCANAKVPTLLVNARLSARSRDGYAKWAPVRTLVQEALMSFKHIAAQSDGDATRIKELGATRVEVIGNMKFDVTIDNERVQLGEQWRSVLLNSRDASGRRVLLAASTRVGEEILLLDAFVRVFGDDGRVRPLLVIVPRHPARFDEVAAHIEARGLSYMRRSALTAEAVAAHQRIDVLLGDSMGEMFAYYAMCDLAFVGGSLVDAGGQNLIEACALGKPVLMGPSTYNFAEVSIAAVDAGALRIYATAEDVMSNARVLLSDAKACAEIGARAQGFAAAHRGATQKTLALVSPLIK
jgi:3-deoxy-D-manno-octulosonic-acid transferase